MATRKRRPQWRVGDEPLFRIFCKDANGDTRSITGKKILFRYKIGALAAVDKEGTIIDGDGGEAQYQCDNDLTSAGDILWEWRISETDDSSPIHGPPAPRRGQVIPVLA